MPRLPDSNEIADPQEQAWWTRFNKRNFTHGYSESPATRHTISLQVAEDRKRALRELEQIAAELTLVRVSSEASIYGEKLREIHRTLTTSP